MNESLKELAVRYFEGPIAPEEECDCHQHQCQQHVEHGIGDLVETTGFHGTYFFSRRELYCNSMSSNEMAASSISAVMDSILERM